MGLGKMNSELTTRNSQQPERNERTPTIDTGAPISVAIDYVDAQLTELWRDVAEAAKAKGGVAAVTMAQVLNIIVRAESYSAANEYVLDVDQITGSHPARVIVMTNDPSEEEMPVQAWVTIHCQAPPSGGRQVCAEQVSVAAGGSAVRQMPAAVIPLLLPDLPVFLWWPNGSPFDDYLFRHLSDSIDRLIVDSSTFENPEGTLVKMYSRLQRDWPNIACTDMNWERVTRWRELVAQFFDGAALRPYLDRIGHVSVDFALSSRGGPVNRSQGFLFAGWLASRLGWKPAGPVIEMLRVDGNRPATTRLYLQASNRPVTIDLRPGEEPGEVPGEIHAVRLEVAGAEPSARPEAIFQVEMQEQGEYCAISVEVGEGETSKRNVHLEPETRAMLLDHELEVFSHDRIYEEALELAGHFIRGTAPSDADANRKIATGEPVSAAPHRARPPEARRG
jgi:glucose-6-phosphate dehydrogenase assembly protein OpcA